MANLKTKIKAILKLIIQYLGYEIRKVNKEYINIDSQQKAYYDQKKILNDIDVNVILDLGANIGQTAKLYQKLFPEATIYCFEPFEEAFTVLSKTYEGFERVKPYKLAVTDTTGSKKFFINKFNPTNSLLAVAADSSKYIDNELTDSVGCIDVQTITLDKFCEQENISKIDVLKMDIQGGELMALKGAVNLISKQSIGLLYTEVLFAKLYENQANFSNLCDWLEKHNYFLYGIYNLNYGKNGVLAWGDAIFVSSTLEKSLNKACLSE